MALINCSECRAEISDSAWFCPRCGHVLQGGLPTVPKWWWLGYEWKSKSNIGGIPLVHVAFGWNLQMGTLRVARGIIAIGQFGIGVITIAQFGIGLLFALGQFAAGSYAIGQFAAGIFFALGQFAAGMSAVGGGELPIPVMRSKSQGPRSSHDAVTGFYTTRDNLTFSGATFNLSISYYI